MFVLYLMFLQCHAIAELKQDMTFLPCYAITDASKRVLCFAIADVKFLLAYTIEMTELIDMFVLCLRFLLCYAIADLKQEREESRREREAASNAACIILARIAGPRYVL